MVPGSFQEQLRAERAERLRRLFHRRQKRIEPRRVLDVVEADERDVVGDLEPGCAHRLDRAERNEVVDGEDRRGSVRELEQPGHPGRASARVRRGLRHQRRVEGDAGGVQRRLIPLSAVAGGRDVVRLHDEPDPSVSERDEMVDELARAARAVAEDDVAVDTRDGAIDEDERNAELGESPQMFSGAIAHRRDHHPLDAVCDQLFDDVPLDTQVCAGVAEDHVVIGSARNLLRGPNDRGEERIRDVRDDHRERARPLPAEPAGEAARHVTELGDRLFDPFPCLGADPFAVVDHPRNSHRGDSRQPGYVSDRGVAWVHRWYR